ncbi:DUF2147 domain-containing protein [Capnocytophaga felis]|uniref:DUF2147 domain-containing protein n=1 Tax=Capnocytophaga felis TaxID=2267611 RepID=A0A5M4BAS5_9FLAO|nr:DUF2147 domain-containing protein [Capnocytophaga felis]GET46246.1 hypothetical protein RCZ01_15480 [Capnocytophaga felis]GET48215.1 hypothetical protein RCZ02_10460 [Capnocytophaga felis]
MRKNVMTCLLVFVSIFALQAQSVLGKWKTVDDETGKEKSIVEIYEKNGLIYGKLVELLEEKNKNAVCSACSGKNKNKPYLGLIIITDLKKDGDEWSGGKILDPKTGKEYKCNMTLENSNKLKVRGYVGISLIGRTQYWQRVR